MFFRIIPNKKIYVEFRQQQFIYRSHEQNTKTSDKQGKKPLMANAFITPNIWKRSSSTGKIS